MRLCGKLKPLLRLLQAMGHGVQPMQGNKKSHGSSSVCACANVVVFGKGDEKRYVVLTPNGEFNTLSIVF